MVCPCECSLKVIKWISVSILKTATVMVLKITVSFCVVKIFLKYCELVHKVHVLCIRHLWFMFSAILITMLWKVAFVLDENVKNIFYIHFWTFFKKAIEVMLLKDSLHCTLSEHRLFCWDQWVSYTTDHKLSGTYSCVLTAQL